MDRHCISPPRPSFMHAHTDTLTALAAPPPRYQQRMSLQKKRSSRFIESISMDVRGEHAPPSTNSTLATPTSSVQSEETEPRSFFESDSSDEEDARPVSIGNGLKTRSMSLRRSFSFRKTARDSMSVVASGRAKLVSIGGPKTKPKDQAPVLPELPNPGILWLLPEVEEGEAQAAQLMEGAAESARQRRSGFVNDARRERWSFAGWIGRR